MASLFTSLSFGLSVGTALAASSTIRLSGVIYPTSSLQITRSSASTAIPLSSWFSLGSSGKGLELAILTEKSNSKDGYVVSLASANSGAIKSKDGSLMAYEALFNSKPVALSSSPTDIYRASGERMPTTAVHRLNVRLGSETNRNPASAEARQGGHDTLVVSITSI